MPGLCFSSEERRRLETLAASKSPLDSVIDAEAETFLTFSGTLKEKCRKLLTFPLPPLSASRRHREGRPFPCDAVALPAQKMLLTVCLE